QLPLHQPGYLFDRRRKDFPKIYLVTLPENLPELTHESVLYLGGQVDLADAPPDPLLDLGVRDARSAMKNQRGIGSPVNPAEQIEIQFGFLFIEAMGRSDCNGEGIHP